MSEKIFKALQYINTEGLNESEWGVFEDRNSDYFGDVSCSRKRQYDGKWLYLWLPINDAEYAQEKIGKPVDHIYLDNDMEEILLYRL